MEICRVVKTKDYTVMSNYHLRDRRLSAKEMGLLSFVLSLPDDWDFTIRGLIGLMRDGKDSIYGALRNLEAFGYVRRRQRRNAKGQLSRVEYSFFEQPQTAPQPPEKLEIPALYRIRKIRKRCQRKRRRRLIMHRIRKTRKRWTHRIRKIRMRETRRKEILN